MSVDLDTLIDELKDRCPVGVELPRSSSTNAISTTVIERWAKDAAGEINKRRRKTTRQETNITTVANTQEYDLPAECRKVIEIIRSHVADTYETLGVPNQSHTLGLANFGSLPSGQEVSASLDLINRQRVNRMRREDAWEHVGTQIRLMFAIQANEVIRVIYEVVDRTLASVPADRFELVMTYLLLRTLDRHIGRQGANIIVTGDSLATDAMTVLNGQKLQKQDEWTTGLNRIGPEVD